METEPQKFCLRWNNHQSNLIQFFDELRKKEDFTDVTLMSDAREIIKCHKIVLAAGSFYFERVFNNVGFQDSTTLVLTHTNFTLLEALIMYMYRGEINIQQDELSALLQVAEELEVKGLINFAEKGSMTKIKRDEVPPSFLNHSPPPSSTPSTTPRLKLENSAGQLANPLSHADLYNFHAANQSINPMPSHGLWSMPAFPFAQHPYHPHYSALSRSYVHSSDTSPLTKKKKISSASMAITPTATPILRTALVGQEVETAHSTSGSNLENMENGTRSNGSANGSASGSATSPIDNSRRYSTDFSHHEDPASPHTDIEDDVRKNSTSRRNSYASSSTAPREWKRYKQYTREDINAAIDVVRSGEMSALRASRKFNVPSRTLYDKVKKLGIKTQRNSGRQPSRQGNGNVNGIRIRSIDNDSARFPYGVGGNADGNIYRNAYGAVEPMDMLMNMKHISPSTSPKPEPHIEDDDSFENMVEDLSIKPPVQNSVTIRPVTPKEELKDETPAPSENCNS